MKRAAEPDDDTGQPPRQQQRTEPAFVRIGTEELPLDTAELDLSGSGLTALPESIGELQALTKLDVSDNELTELPAAIGSLTALTELGVASNYLTGLPPITFSLTALKRLYVRENKLTELPAAIGSLTALTKLDVESNCLKELPATIGSLSALTYLKVRANQLTELPTTIGSLTALTRLDVGNNQLLELPAAIGSLTALTRLDVDWNQLTVLPAAISSLTALTELHVDHNQLSKLPAAIGSLTALMVLDVNYNQLTELPAAIGSLTALTRLYVGDNQLKELPAAVFSLTALRKLYVYSNQLTELPTAVGSLTALTRLDLSSNQLTELPATIGSLTALTKLYVYSNQLQELPAAIGSLADNTKLKLDGNPLQLPPLAVAERGPAAIRAYFQDLLAGPAVARTCMLMLLGDAEMGKTSLLNGLLNDCTPLPAPAGPDGRTIHLDIKPLSLGAGGSVVEFKCYDLGGQHKSYAAAQQAYLACGALYLLVVSAEAATSDAHEGRLRWWLHILQTNALGAVVQPILTHVDKCTEAEAAERAAWVVGVCRKHLDRVNALPAGSPAPLSIQLGPVPLVNAAAGGGATLSAVRDRLLALACPPAGQPKLLPVVGQTIPKLWEPAMEYVRAVRSGADCTAAASTALLGTCPPSPTAVDSGGRPLLYTLVPALQGKWEQVAAALVVAELVAAEAEEKEEDDEEEEDPATTQLRQRKAAFSSPSQRRSILTNALQLMANQGEIFLSGDIAYLDPAAITSLIAPLVDHRLNDVDVYLSAGPGKDVLAYLLKSMPPADVQTKLLTIRASLEKLTGPRALLDPDLLSFLWRDQEHHDEHRRMLCDAGLLLRLTNPDEYVMPLRLETTAPPGLDAAWRPATPLKEEVQFRRVYKWDSAGFVPPGLCEKMTAAFQGVAGCRYLRDASGSALVWQRGALLELGGATFKLEVAVVKEGGDLLLQLVADARGTDEGRVRALLETGDVHTTLGSVLAGFPGIPGLRMLSEAGVTRMQVKRMRSAVAVTVGNQHIGTAKEVDCHLSAQQLNAALQGRGLRVEPPWIDQSGGAPMLDRLRQVLVSEVRPTDDGFVFCFCGHGDATDLLGNDNVRTSCQAIINVIASEQKLQGKPKLLVFDCSQLVAQLVASAGLDQLLNQLQLPKDMILARSTGLTTVAFEQPGVGNDYSKRLATAISSYAAAYSVEYLLKLAQGQKHKLATPAPQIAHVDSALGAYHLFLGPV